MKKIMLMALALSFNALSAQEFDDNQSDNQEMEVIGAAENAEDVGPNDIAAEQEEKQQHDVAQIGNDEAELNDSENETEE
jgi:hypothetical protein